MLSGWQVAGQFMESRAVFSLGLQNTTLCGTFYVWCKTGCLRTMMMVCSFFVEEDVILHNFHWCWARIIRYRKNLQEKWRGDFCRIFPKRSLFCSHLQAKCMNNVSNLKMATIQQLRPRYSLSVMSIKLNVQEMMAVLVGALTAALIFKPLASQKLEITLFCCRT